MRWWLPAASIAAGNYQMSSYMNHRNRAQSGTLAENPISKPHQRIHPVCRLIVEKFHKL